MAMVDDDTQAEPALTRNWNEMSRLEQIVARHRIWDRSGLPNGEYTASWYDVQLLLEANATLANALDNLVKQLPNNETLANFNLDPAEAALLLARTTTRAGGE